MEKVIFENTKVPIKLWLNDMEDGALQQAKNAASLPFIYHHLAVMPDAHQGYGVSIGSVLAIDGVVIPNAVGVDIGCGMCAVKTSLKAEQLDKETLKKIMGEIRKAIPVGFEHHKEKRDISLMPNADQVDGKGIIHIEFQSALTQLGTLGGGNHFIEIQKDTKNNIWIMIHSGSRNLGYKVANYYNKLAIELNKKWFSSVPKEWELAFLPIETQEAKNYMNEMQYCVDFALANRMLMLIRICDVFSKEFNFNKGELSGQEPPINIAHNYAQWENHFDKNVIIHRKGATSARLDEMGIIPGSQGTKSYIVEGLGNLESFQSCSHGAGRKLGRKEACRSLNLEKEIKQMDEKGIIHGIRNQSNLDEAPGAYKNIDEVMNNQKDLVKILVELEPLAVIKGE